MKQPIWGGFRRRLRLKRRKNVFTPRNEKGAGQFRRPIRCDQRRPKAWRTAIA